MSASRLFLLYLELFNKPPDCDLHFFHPLLVMILKLRLLQRKLIIRFLSYFFRLGLQLCLQPAGISSKLLLYDSPFPGEIIPRYVSLIVQLLHPHLRLFVIFLPLFHDDLLALHHAGLVVPSLLLKLRLRLLPLLLLLRRGVKSDGLNLGLDLRSCPLSLLQDHFLILLPLLGLLGVEAGQRRLPPLRCLGRREGGVDGILLFVRFGIKVERILKLRRVLFGVTE
mmetsp:Transcript_1648/g.4793  ORF Transcript_1648/g.4793 Transcript_1648/m.4793 type:complete len:225 (-) Transcript_1648:869-1543(-)